ncbi:MAG: winged helix-turn-helix transcriptional regulator [Candidatus Nitrosopolaris sp.]|jgi:predicted transcriptional regulator
MLILSSLPPQNIAQTKNNAISDACTSEAVDTKSIILKYINSVPGIRYRELLRLTGLPNGTLEYHLKIFESTHKVTTFRRSGRRTGYYPNDIPADESHILEHVRNQVARQIVLFILENDLCTFDSILKNIKKAPSTLSWHLKRLSEAEIISVIYRQKLQLYRIVNSKLVSGMFSLPINEQPMRIMPMERKLEIHSRS